MAGRVSIANEMSGRPTSALKVNVSTRYFKLVM
jgi:hypothetical protein